MVNVSNDAMSTVGIDTSAGDFTLAANIGPTTRALAKLGANTLILSGTNSYTGGTTVEAGTLLATTNTATPDGTSLTVAAGGTFAFDPLGPGGSPVVAGAVSAVRPGVGGSGTRNAGPPDGRGRGGLRRLEAEEKLVLIQKAGGQPIACRPPVGILFRLS